MIFLKKPLTEKGKTNQNKWENRNCSLGGPDTEID